MLALVRPEFFREQRQAPRFAGRDHVSIELRPISRRSARAIAKAMLGETADEHGARSHRGAGRGLAALRRGAGASHRARPRREHGAHHRGRHPGEPRRARRAEPRRGGATLGLRSLAVGTAGSRRSASPRREVALRKLAAADLLVEQAESRLAGAREWAFKHALVRDVAYASLGEEQKKELHAKAGAWLAKMGEDAATVAKHFEIGDRPADGAVYWETAARRALATNALTEAVRMAGDRARFAEGKPTTFARALLLDEAWTRLDPRAADRETAVLGDGRLGVRRSEPGPHRGGARALRRRARRRRPTSCQRLSEARESAKKLGLVDEEARCTATLAARNAFGGRARRRRTRGRPPARDRRNARHPRRRGRRLADARRRPPDARRAGERARARRNAARAASQAGLQEREAMLSVNLGFALTTIGARSRGPRSDRRPGSPSRTPSAAPAPFATGG